MQGRLVEGVPENVTSIASGRTISDAICSGEICKVWGILARTCGRTFIFVQFHFFVVRALRCFSRFRLELLCLFTATRVERLERHQPRSLR